MQDMDEMVRAMTSQRFIELISRNYMGNPPNTVMVVGCGGVGSWTALFLAISGVNKLILVDNDKVADHNLGRTPYRMWDVGEYKVYALQNILYEYRPAGLEVEAIPEPYDTRILATRAPNVVVDCTDNTGTQDRIRDDCKRLGVIYARAGYDVYEDDLGRVRFGITAELLKPDEIKEEWGEGGEGYGLNASYVVPAVMAAILVVDRILKLWRGLTKVEMKRYWTKLSVYGG